MLEIHDPALLAELDLLFAPDNVIDVAGDAGWNCYAKAFTAMWLLRLWGEQSQSYEGRLLIVSLAHKRILNVCPHAWAGISDKRIVDLSIRDVAGLRYLTVLGGQTVEGRDWKVFVERDRTRYDRVASGQISTFEEKFLVYHPERVRLFSEESIDHQHGTFSPSVGRTLSRYRENLLPKAILHIFQFAEGETSSLSTDSNTSPWNVLEKWRIDARHELHVRLRNPA